MINLKIKQEYIMGYMFFIWLIIMIVAVIVEIATTDLTSIWFAVGAFGSLIFSIFLKDRFIYIQIIIFACLSLITILILKPIIKKHIDSPKIATNIDAMIGKTVLVESDISPLSPGTVKAEGIVWTAESNEESFVAGDLVIISEIKGNTLIVKKG